MKGLQKIVFPGSPSKISQSDPNLEMVFGVPSARDTILTHALLPRAAAPVVLDNLA